MDSSQTEQKIKKKKQDTDSSQIRDFWEWYPQNLTLDTKFDMTYGKDMV